MEDGLLLIISLLRAVSLLSMLAEKRNIAYPIFLVISGLALKAPRTSSLLNPVS